MVVILLVTLGQTRGSGNKFEAKITSVINQYTRVIWRNIRIETLLTQQGNTEIDILFCYKDVVFIVESKNISQVFGDYGGLKWSFIGSTKPNQDVREYTSLNVITQNNIHARSFKDMFYAYYKEWPIVIPIIVVPNECCISPELESAVYTLSEFESILIEMNTWEVESRVQRRVASLIFKDGMTIERPDFVYDSALGKRVRK